MARRAVFPGSFDPLTVAHVAVAEAVLDQLDVHRLDLVISEVALAKEDRRTTSARHRAAAANRILADWPEVTAHVTASQLLADIATGYDVLVIGADKWAQLLDVAFYGSPEARDRALARLPVLAIAPRAGHSVPGGADLVGPIHVLDVDPVHHRVSSTAVRAGRDDWRA